MQRSRKRQPDGRIVAARAGDRARTPGPSAWCTRERERTHEGIHTGARTAHAHAPHTPRVGDTTAASGLVTRQRPRDAVGKHPRLCACTHSTAHTATQHPPPPPTPHTHTHALACAQTPPAVRRAPSTWPSTSGATRLAAQPPAPARAATHVVPRTSSHKHRPHPAQRQTSPSAVAQTAAICLMTEDWQAWVVLHRLCDAHRACSGSSDPGVRARCQHRPSARPRCFAAGCAATHIDGRLAAARPCVGERPRVQGGRPGVSAACMRCS
jgi:hypothetical protein